VKSISHDLLLLMTNLSQMRDHDLVLSIFEEALNNEHKGFSIEYQKEKPLVDNYIDICTGSRTYGYFIINGKLKDVTTEFPAVFSNSVQILATILEKIHNDKLLKNEKLLLENEVEAKTKSIQLSEKKHRSMVANISDVIGIIDINGTVKYKSPNIEKWFGWKPDELIGANSWKSVHPDDLNALKDEFTEITKVDGTATTVEYRYLCKNKSYKWIELTATNRLNDPSIEGILLNYHDIHERKQLEKIQEARIRLIEFSLNHTVNELLTEFLDEVEKLTGSESGFFHFLDDDQETLSLQAWSTNTLFKMCSVKGLENHYPLSEAGVWVDCVRKKEPVIYNDYDTLGHKKGLPEGHASIKRLLSVPVFRGKKISAILGVGNKKTNYSNADINTVQQLADLAWETVVRKRTEKALKESESKFRNVIEQSNDAIYIMVDNEFDLINRRFTELTDISEEDILKPGFDLMDYLSDESKELVKRREKLRESGKTPPDVFEFTIVDKKDRHHQVQASITKIDYRNGKAFLVILRDISEQKVLEDQLRQAQKIESIGHLAGGIAHDFNNLLTPIIGSSELGMLNLAPSHPAYNEFREINETAYRASDLTRQLLAFSRKQVLETKMVDLNRLIENFRKILRRTIREDVHIDIQYKTSSSPVKVDISQIEQILMNLVVNAQDSMPDGGVIVVETDSIKFNQDYSDSHPEVEPGEYITLSVSDTGEGMDDGTIQMIFDPFFTTKAIGKGTGLGLSTVHGIIKQHGGHIWVYSEKGTGSTFKLCFPTIVDSSLKADDLNSEIDLHRGSGTVLIVEDQEQVRKIAARILTRKGYTVHLASNGEEALSIIRANNLVLDLLLTDVIMPEMNGQELYDRMKELQPDLKALFMSGYTNDVIAHHGMLEKGINFIQKPLTIETLSKKVKEVIEKK
jgi:PAS domain S-box-containing protein